MPIMIFQQRRPVSGPSVLVLHKDPSAHEIVTSVMPSVFACSYIKPSTSLDTADVHSSSMAYDGR